MRARTQVTVIGAGPAGLLLSYLLRLEGLDVVVLESRSREYIENRLRAGLCEPHTVDLLRQLGLADRLDAEGHEHHGFSMRFDDADHRIALTELTGRSVVIYGQQEIVKDLVAAHLARDWPIEFEVSDVDLHDLETENPRVTYRDSDGVAHTLDSDVIAGCDGFHGISRPSIPASRLKVFDRKYPFAWLGILAETQPISEEPVYGHHERGFSLTTRRTPTHTRAFIQVPLEDTLDDWSDDRLWAELDARLASSTGSTLKEGPILHRTITAMRSFVAEPMRYGRLFLAGDAAHIVPPTGAKGMNLAVADIRVLSRALTELLLHKRSELADAYSDTCLKRVWRAEHFAWFMTSMLHVDPDADAFQRRLQLSQLRYTVSSHAAALSLAENYVGLPFD